MSSWTPNPALDPDVFLSKSMKSLPSSVLLLMLLKFLQLVNSKSLIDGRTDGRNISLDIISINVINSLIWLDVTHGLTFDMLSRSTISGSPAPALSVSTLSAKHTFQFLDAPSGRWRAGA